MRNSSRHDSPVERRTFLSAVGTGVITGLAGCLGFMGGGPKGPKKGDDLPSDPNPTDGLPPDFDTTPAERNIDTASYDTTRESGVDVPLAPIDDVYYWYARGEARFADARSLTAYQQSHIYGAVLSSAPDGVPNDPVANWPKDERIVCYCACPHHLSSMRASTLISAGYEEVYVIDEGFREWYARNYPIAGVSANSLAPLRTIEGMTAPTYAGQNAWARHVPSGQREVASIAEDGRYELHLTFADVTDESPITIETPAYTIEAPLGVLTSELVTGN